MSNTTSLFTLCPESNKLTKTELEIDLLMPDCCSDEKLTQLMISSRTDVSLQRVWFWYYAPIYMPFSVCVFFNSTYSFDIVQDSTARRNDAKLGFTGEFSLKNSYRLRAINCMLIQWKHTHLGACWPTSTKHTNTVQPWDTFIAIIHVCTRCVHTYPPEQSTIACMH